MVMTVMAIAVCVGGWVVTISEVEPRWRRLCHSKPASHSIARPLHVTDFTALHPLPRGGGGVQGGLTEEPPSPPSLRAGEECLWKQSQGWPQVGGSHEDDKTA